MALSPSALHRAQRGQEGGRSRREHTQALSVRARGFWEGDGSSGGQAVTNLPLPSTENLAWVAVT